MSNSETDAPLPKDYISLAKFLGITPTIFVILVILMVTIGFLMMGLSREYGWVPMGVVMVIFLILFRHYARKHQDKLLGEVEVETDG